MWDIFLEVIAKALKYETEIHSFVLMANHFHMMVSTPQKNLDNWMRYLLTEVCKKVQRKANRINHIFGGRYKPTLLWGPYEVAYVYKYILRNPVRASICERAEDYPYSTLNENVVFKQNFPLVDGIRSIWAFVPKERQKLLNWLNIPAPKEAEELVTRALRRTEFKFTTDSNFQADLRKLKRIYGIEGELT